MTLIEARRPDGKGVELLEVDVTKSGLLIMITDHGGNQVFIPRYAWDDVIKEVTELFAQEERQAQAWIKERPEC